MARWLGRRVLDCKMHLAETYLDLYVPMQWFSFYCSDGNNYWTLSGKDRSQRANLSVDSLRRTHAENPNSSVTPRVQRWQPVSPSFCNHLHTANRVKSIIALLLARGVHRFAASVVVGRGDEWTFCFERKLYWAASEWESLWCFLFRRSFSGSN